MTGFADALVAILVALVVNVLISHRIRLTLPGDEGRLLAGVYWGTLLLRFSLALFLNMGSASSSFASAFWGDSFVYDRGGHLLSLYWSGESLINPYVESRISGWGFYYFVGAFYYVFGQNQLLIQLVNATIGAVTVLVIYAIAKDLFDAQVAKWAARFMAFFPQIVFWSGAMYKDPAIMLCIAVCMYALLKLRREFRLGYVVLYVLFGLALMTLRFYVFYVVVFATLGTFVLSQRRGVVGSVFVQLLLVGAFLGAFSFAASRESVERQTEYFSLEKVEIARADQARWGQSGFSEEADVSTVGGALAALPTGLVYLLLAPFPWAISGLRQALTVPETLVWYALMPAFARGLFLTVRTRFRDALPILAFAGALTCAYAIFQGNVGTAYRQRTQVTMFFFVFMAAGVVERQRARQQPARVRPPQPAYLAR